MLEEYAAYSARTTTLATSATTALATASHHNRPRHCHHHHHRPGHRPKPHRHHGPRHRHVTTAALTTALATVLHRPHILTLSHTLTPTPTPTLTLTPPLTLARYVEATKGPNGEPGVVIVHVEANVHLHRTLDNIRKMGGAHLDRISIASRSSPSPSPSPNLDRIHPSLFPTL